jgi:hypothetical protein
MCTENRTLGVIYNLQMGAESGPLGAVCNLQASIKAM